MLLTWGAAGLAGLPAHAQQATPPAAPALRLPDTAYSAPSYADGGTSQASDIRQAVERRTARRNNRRSNPLPLPRPEDGSNSIPRASRLQTIPGITTASTQPAPRTPSVSPQPPAPPTSNNDTSNAQGLRLGTFLLTGEVETGGVFSTRHDNRGRNAVGLRTLPDLRLASNWPRHELSFTARGEFIAWNRGSHKAKGNLGMGLRLDARRDTRLRLGIDYAVDEAGATSTDLQHEVDTTATLEHERYRMTAALTGGMLVHLEPGRARDYIQPHASARLRLRTSPALAIYGEADIDARRFRKDARGNDSIGGSAEVGVELLRGPIWEGRIGLRGELRHYRDKARRNLKGIGVSGNLTWRPTRQTDIGLEAAFDLQDDAAGPTRQQTAALSWRQQLRRTLELRGRVEGEYNAVQGGQDAITLRATASLAWQIWRKLWIVASYGVERDYIESLSRPSGKPEHQLGLGLRQKF